MVNISLQTCVEVKYGCDSMAVTVASATRQTLNISSQLVLFRNLEERLTNGVADMCFANFRSSQWGDE